MPNSPTTCPTCGYDHCNDIINLADRLAAVEARLPPTFEQLVERAGPVSPTLPLVAPPPSAEPTTHCPLHSSSMVRAEKTYPDGTVAPALACEECPLEARRVRSVLLDACDKARAAKETQPATTASGASVPDGYVLADGWTARATVVCWACPNGASPSPGISARFGGAVTGYCYGHIRQSNGLVPVEPPKAETDEVDWSRFVPTEEIPEAIGGEEPEAGAVVASWSKRCRAGSVRRWVAGTDDPVRLAGEKRFHRAHYRLIRHADGRWADGFNPSGPCMSWCGHGVGRGVAGFCTPFCVERHEKRLAPKAETAQAAEPSAPVGSTPCCFELIDRRPGAHCTLRRGHDGRHGTAADAPPVAAKLSERPPGWDGDAKKPLSDRLYGLMNLLPREWLERGCALAAETEALETALDAASKAYRILEMELDAAKRDRGQLREQLNVARREVDAAKAENEALRAKLESQEAETAKVLAERKAAYVLIEARDRRIALLEASHREDVEAKVREAVEKDRERCRLLFCEYCDGNMTLNEMLKAVGCGDPAPKVGG